MREFGDRDCAMLVNAAGVTVTRGRGAGMRLLLPELAREPGQRFFRPLRAQSVAVHNGAGRGPTQDGLHAATEAVAGALDDAFVEPARAAWWRSAGRARVWIGDDFLRLWMTQAPENATQIIDCQTAAEARFEALFGSSATDWAIAAEWDAIAPFLCTAMPWRLLTAIRENLAGRGLRLDSIAPDFIEYYNYYQDRFELGDWFVVIGSKRVTLATLRRKGGLVRSVQLGSVKALARPQPNAAAPAGGLSSPPASIARYAPLDERWLQQSIALEARRFGVEMPRRVLLSGLSSGRTGPAHWTSSSTQFEWLGA
jgi:hypothetical protein